MAKINIAYLADLLPRGYKQYVKWDYVKSAHAAIQGATGTGKTYLLKLILARLARSDPGVRMTVCDYKGDKDFSFLSGLKRFHRFEDCMDGLGAFYAGFLEIQKRGGTGTAQFLVFDEWASFLNNLEKKDAADAKKKLSSLLMLGRSMGCYVILSQQRLDASYFESARDNFNLMIALGTPSKEAREMFFHDYKDQIKDSWTPGGGYMLTNGSDLQKIVVPRIPLTAMEAIERTIRAAVERSV